VYAELASGHWLLFGQEIRKPAGWTGFLGLYFYFGDSQRSSATSLTASRAIPVLGEAVFVKADVMFQA